MNKSLESVKPSVSQIALTEKVEQAQAIGAKYERTFVSSIFKTILEKELVLVSIPGKSAKYLKPVKGHKILVFNDEKLDKLTMIDVKDHFVHGDFTIRKADGQVRPSVVRHFCVKESSLGKEIAANVVVKQKKCLLTGDITIIIDIIELLPGNYQTKQSLCLGGNVTGKTGEIIIPGTDRCIRIDEVKAQRITNQGEEISRSNFVIEEKPTEKKHRLTFKAPVKERIDVQSHLRLEKKPKLILKKQNQN